MKNDLTDITLIVDRSGSMSQVREDAEGGVNTFISEQAAAEDAALLTLVQFDTEYEFVHQGVPIQEVPKYELVPRGMTALLDAIGRAINETGERLAKMPEEQRPGLVVMIIMTDGEENSSREFTKAQIREMIEHQQNKYNWQFTFLGANQDAFAEAGSIGIKSAGVATYSVGKTAETYQAVSNQVRRMRKQSKTNQTIDNKFTESELDSME